MNLWKPYLRLRRFEKVLARYVFVISLPVAVAAFVRMILFAILGY